MEYDVNNRKIKQFVATDSTQYFMKWDMKSDFSVSKSCVYCEEKNLNQEWKYKENKLEEWNSYTYKKEKHTKKIISMMKMQISSKLLILQDGISRK